MSAKYKYNTYGFGVDPFQCKNHFFVVVPRKATELVQIYERYGWTNGKRQILGDSDVLRLELSRQKWNLVSSDLTTEFNIDLKQQYLKIGKFIIGGTPVERLLGKEMMVLLWGIEHIGDMELSIISTAIRNWKGLMQEERWWLYTMTNAATGHMHDTRGWRTALRCILCEI